MPDKKPILYITIGDINGIGPEVTLKAVAQLLPLQMAVFVLIGIPAVIQYYLDLLHIRLPIVEAEPTADPDRVFLLPINLSATRAFVPGKVTRIAGKGSAVFLQTAIAQLKAMPNSGLVTAPISKEALWWAGYLFPGQTEFLANAFSVTKYAMILLAGDFRVGFITTHHALRDVPSLLKRKLIEEKCLVIRDDLRRKFKIKKPCFAIAALNPHGGENGHLGSEEKDIIIPAVRKLQERGIFIEGPFPSDSLFTPRKLKTYDVFIALYHDQGMIPIKMQAFGKAVNYTAGLPTVRTSPDHGTAFDIAGTGVADASSMVEAIRLAAILVDKKGSASSAV